MPCFARWACFACWVVLGEGGQGERGGGKAFIPHPARPVNYPVIQRAELGIVQCASLAALAGDPSTSSPSPIPPGIQSSRLCGSCSSLIES